MFEDARVHVLADCGIFEVLVFEDPVEVVQLVLDLLGGGSHDSYESDF